MINLVEEWIKIQEASELSGIFNSSNKDIDHGMSCSNNFSLELLPEKTDEILNEKYIPKYNGYSLDFLMIDECGHFKNCSIDMKFEDNSKIKIKEKSIRI